MLDVNPEVCQVWEPYKYLRCSEIAMPNCLFPKTPRRASLYFSIKAKLSLSLGSVIRYDEQSFFLQPLVNFLIRTRQVGQPGI